MVDKTAKVHKGAKIGPNVVIGPGCVVEEVERVIDVGSKNQK